MGRSARPGQVIALSGDLGAGKTQLVKGIARGLGIPARVHSPTFTLVNIYTGGRMALYHLDLYRLAGIEDILSAGLEEYLSPEGVTVIEWAERWLPAPLMSKTATKNVKASADQEINQLSGAVTGPAQPAWVYIEALSKTERRITYEDPRD